MRYVLYAPKLVTVQRYTVWQKVQCETHAVLSYMYCVCAADDNYTHESDNLHTKWKRYTCVCITCDTSYAQQLGQQTEDTYAAAPQAHTQVYILRKQLCTSFIIRLGI